MKSWKRAVVWKKVNGWAIKTDSFQFSSIHGTPLAWFWSGGPRTVWKGTPWDFITNEGPSTSFRCESVLFLPFEKATLTTLYWLVYCSMSSFSKTLCFRSLTREWKVESQQIFKFCWALINDEIFILDCVSKIPIFGAFSIAYLLSEFLSLQSDWLAHAKQGNLPTNSHRYGLG